MCQLNFSITSKISFLQKSFPHRFFALVRVITPIWSSVKYVDFCLFLLVCKCTKNSIKRHCYYKKTPFYMCHYTCVIWACFGELSTQFNHKFPVFKHTYMWRCAKVESITMWIVNSIVYCLYIGFNSFVDKCEFIPI